MKLPRTFVLNFQACTLACKCHHLWCCATKDIIRRYGVDDKIPLHKDTEVTSGDLHRHIAEHSHLSALMAASLNDYDNTWSHPRHSTGQVAVFAPSTRTSGPPGWARSVDYQHPITLPTPPTSNRPSLEESTVTSANFKNHNSGHQHHQRAEPTVTADSPTSPNLPHPEHQHAERVSFISPPASPPRVAKRATLDAIAAKVKPVTDGLEETCTIKGVTPMLFEEFDSWAAENLPGWESLRCEIP